MPERSACALIGASPSAIGLIKIDGKAFGAEHFFGGALIGAEQVETASRLPLRSLSSLISGRATKKCSDFAHRHGDES